MITATVEHRRIAPWRAAIGMFLVYVLLAALYTRPLLQESTSRIVNDPGDPILNASILWWNATVLPFSSDWWSPPFFHPAKDVATFTENLVGIGPFSTPIYWLTRNPLTAYNLAVFLTWPLSAFAAFLLTWFLTRRLDAAFIGGLAFGFSPYRTSELGHMQTLSAYWFPPVLLGLHGFLEQRRGRWLVLFGAAWLLQSLSNGYFLLQGGVLVGLWLLYFCSTRRSWRAAPPILLVWAVASAPLVPILLKYQAVHEYYGLRRSPTEIQYFSATPSAWIDVSQVVRFWHLFLPEANDNLFPGVTAVSLVAIALLLHRHRSSGGAPREATWLRSRALRAGLSLLTAGSVAASVIYLINGGPWSLSAGNVLLLRVDNLNRTLPLIAIFGVPLLPRLLRSAIGRILRRRSPLFFYSAATVAVMVFCCGPALRVANITILDPAPYGWLMHLPGFDQLRVPTRFWMLGVLCLGVAAGLAFRSLTERSASSGPLIRRRNLLFAACVFGLLLDSWLTEMPMAAAPPVWADIEPPGVAPPILELPIGPGWDAAPTFRSMAHRRGVFNGVSGYDPAHYAPLQAGLRASDPTMLEALASLGSFDVVVREDPDGRWSRYVLGAPGATRLAANEAATVYRIPAIAPREAVLGAALPIVEVRSGLLDPSVVLDGDPATEWWDGPQHPDQSLTADLGRVVDVGGVTQTLGEWARDFPRRLAIDLSTDGVEWQTVWEGPTASLAFLAAAREPLVAPIRIAFTPAAARFVRLRQLETHQNLWRIAELTIHGAP